MPTPINVTVSGATTTTVQVAGRTQLSVSVSPDTEFPNVLVVVLDDVGTDKLSMYGQPGLKARTPCLDALAAAGIRFTRAYAEPLCSPFRAVALTGRYSFRHGLGAVVNQSSPWEIPSAEQVLAEAISAGRPGSVYQTEAYGKWHVSVTDGTTAKDRFPVDSAGFFRWVGSIGNMTATSESVSPPGADVNHYYWRRISAFPASTTAAVLGSTTGPYDLTTYANTNIRATLASRLNTLNASGQPFVIYYCQNAPHSPHIVPPHDGIGYDAGSANSIISQDTIDGIKVGGGSYAQGALPAPSDIPAGTGLPTPAEQQEHRIQYYNAALEGADRELALLLMNMNQAQLANTLLIVISDNGSPAEAIDASEFGLGPYQAVHAKNTCYEQGIRVPLIVANIGSMTYTGSLGSPSYSTTPGRLPYPINPGSTSDALVCSPDLWATVLEACKADTTLANPGGLTIDSRSFLPALKGGTGTRDRVFAETFSPNGFGPYSLLRRSYMREDGWKYITHDGAEYLFNVIADPLEQTDEKANEPGIFATLKAEMEALLGSP